MPIAELSSREPTEIAHNWWRSSIGNVRKPPTLHGSLASREPNSMDNHESSIWTYRKLRKRFAS
jgi:hypothetical protein